MSAEHATPAASTGEAVSSTIQNATNVVVEKSGAAYDAVANHPITQNVVNGPVAENVKAEAAKTSSEFSNLSSARVTPSQPAATGQKLTHYHSFFSSLLSWENPRASGIAYASVVVFILGARYLDFLRYIFKISWMTLGITFAAEAAGKAIFNKGFTSQFRPRRYYIVPKDTLDAMIGDVHELINFFVIESQRIVFAENVYATGAAFVSAFLSYYLIQLVPFWGLALIGTSTIFLGPLVYKTNKEFIDHHLKTASDVVIQQQEQMKAVASRQASVVAETTKQYAAQAQAAAGGYAAQAQEAVGGYTAQAQEMIQARTGRSVSPVAQKSASSTPAMSASETKVAPLPTQPTTEKVSGISEKHAGDIGAAPLSATSESTSHQFKSEDFPAAPTKPFTEATPIANEFTEAPKVTTSAKDEPLLA